MRYVLIDRKTGCGIWWGNTRQEMRECAREMSMKHPKIRIGNLVLARYAVIFTANYYKEN